MKQVFLFYELPRPISSRDSKRPIHKNHSNPYNKISYLLIARTQLIGIATNDDVFHKK